jgi:hypothetical protein
MFKQLRWYKDSVCLLKRNCSNKAENPIYTLFHLPQIALNFAELNSKTSRLQLTAIPLAPDFAKATPGKHLHIGQLVYLHIESFSHWEFFLLSTRPCGLIAPVFAESLFQFFFYSPFTFFSRRYRRFSLKAST